MINRRCFLYLGVTPLLPRPTVGKPGGFPSKAPNRALFPRPEDGVEVGVNPPGFAWWRTDGVTAYRVTVRDSSGAIAYRSSLLEDPVHLPNRVLQPGTYSWDVEALDTHRQLVDRRGVQTFDIPPDLPELPWEDPRKILSRVPKDRPRYIFTNEELPKIRESLRTSRREAWTSIQRLADEALDLPLPEPPQYHTFDTPARRRMGYLVYFRDFRRFIDRGMSTLALAYLMTGDERYGLAAKKLLLEVESWGMDGPMSVLSRFGDEPGLSMARHGHRAYDWLYPLLDESERARVRQMTIERARQVLRRLRRADYLALPSESHNGRMIAYLTEYAIVVNDEASDSAEWLDYSLKALTTFYPHWAGREGGWAEGIGYGGAYNTVCLPSIECLRTATGFDLFKRSFYRNVRRFFIHCSSPIGEIRPFGDGAERSNQSSLLSALLMHHGRRFKDPAAVWWARQTGEIPVGSDPMVSLITEDDIPPEAPQDTQTAELFQGVGWAAFHSALDKPKEDTFFIFKSSPYGSVSHSHADQNSFCILKGGRALAIASGHYGPGYGMPHHAEWTRQTKANNSILVDGEGQIVRSADAQGRISDFKHQKVLSYLCGDAAAAYGGKLSLFRRHVLFLRPGVVLLLDELEAVGPARYQWLLHSLDKMELSATENSVTSSRDGALLQVRLACETGLDLSQTHLFDTPYNEGNPEEYQEEVSNHWHFTASTQEPAAKTRIGALMLVTSSNEDLTANWKSHAGWMGLSIKTPLGWGEAWVQASVGSPPPPGVEEDVRMLAVWEGIDGSTENLSIA